ncbi:MAG TPA: hypothetical protein VJ742_09565, partial [Nitrososphaera sp.]|nr:hypothetical protein [Nitrososphaera sp.]
MNEHDTEEETGMSSQQTGRPVAESGLCWRSRDPPRLGREGKRELTKSAKEFPKAYARPSPRGSLRRHGSERTQ